MWVCGLMYTTNWFPEACLSQSKSQRTDSCSQTSQDFSVWWQNKWRPGGNKLSGPSTTAISCGQIQETICLLVTPTYPATMVAFFLHGPATKANRWTAIRLTEIRQMDTNKWTDTHVCQSCLNRQTDKDRLVSKQRQIAVSKCLFWHFSSVKILMNRLHVQSPVAPWDFPNHGCWGPQNINFI